MPPPRLRLAVLGCGAVFERFHLPALARSSSWELLGVCDVSAERQDWFRRASPGIAVFDSPHPLLAVENLDAVLVATPPDSHTELALEALKAGLHVLVEKPMATRVSDARRLVDAVEASGTRLFVGFNRRFRDSYRKVRDEVAARPAGLQGIRYSFAADLEWVAGRPGHPVSLDILLHDIGSHQIDMVAWITGRTVRRARARATRAGGESEVRVELETGAIVASCTAAYAPRYHERLEVDQGGRTLVVRPGGLSRSKRAPEGISEAWGRLRHIADLSFRRATGKPSRSDRSFDRQLTSFADAIRGAPSACADVGDGYHAVAVVEACRESLADGGAWKAVDPHRALAEA